MRKGDHPCGLMAMVVVTATTGEQRMSDELTIRRLPSGEPPPWGLLLLADPSRPRVEAYLADGLCYVATLAKPLPGAASDAVIGVFVLAATRPHVYELMNVAVAENHQGRGRGKQLVHAAIVEARRLGAEVLEVGTGNSSLQQLALYQKCGFRIVGVERDFFKEGYGAEIYENGIRCLDMIRLSMPLT
jgi:ribosomal protein S18 acetylase RimI-like enzyme